MQRPSFILPGKNTTIQGSIIEGVDDFVANLGIINTLI